MTSNAEAAFKGFVWHWGRFGGGPRYALELNHALNRYTQLQTTLSLSTGAEILQGAHRLGPPEHPIETYSTRLEFLWRTATIRRRLRPLVRQLEMEMPDIAVNAMPAYWDLFLIRRLRRLNVPVITVVHDSALHPGDRFPFAHELQQRAVKASAGILTLTEYVADQMRRRGWLDGKLHRVVPHVAFAMEELDLSQPSLPDYNGKRPLKLALMGRIRTYKGLDLLAQALRRLTPSEVQLRIVGAGADERMLEALQQLPGVGVYRRWLSDADFIEQIDWADTVILPYVEASQSGVIPLAYRRARPVIATPVGGLPEQVRHEETGLLAGDVSAEALAEAIGRFVDRPALLRHCAEGARTLADGAWSWREIAPAIASFAREVVQDWRSRTRADQAKNLS